ncbi:MAG: homoprotocatechuate degradation operon regulator HpaR [Hyphomicrobiaceae bacterium]|nr:homoprotocatechuate degradation operon regulator HpaR [Hyphomicrobiaceae bacterium]
MRPLRKSLPLRLLQAREAVMERFRPHLNAHDLTEQQWRVLRALAEVGESEVGALAGAICLLGPSLSRILPELEQRGLVARRRADGDRRTSLVSLTREGRVQFEAMAKRSEAIYRDIEVALEAAGCPDIIADLERLIAALEAGATPDGKTGSKLAKV